MSPHSSRPVLVMGASGSVGHHVLDALLEQQIPVRASSRKPVPGQFPDGVETFSADLTDPATLVPTFDGAGQVFLYANHEGVDGVIDVARAARVEKIVLMSSGSVIHPTSTGNSITEEHRDVEQAFAAATDLTVVPIRPLVLATNSLGWSRSIEASRTVALYKPDALTAPIHERDIAAVVVAALIGEVSPIVSGMLTGPARLSQRAQVATIGRAIGRKITVDELTRDQALAHYSRFMSETEAEAVLRFLDDAAEGNSPTSSTVRDVLGRPALDFGTWAADHADELGGN